MNLLIYGPKVCSTTGSVFIQPWDYEVLNILKYTTCVFLNRLARQIN
jgi:hypothetical protein